MPQAGMTVVGSLARLVGRSTSDGRLLADFAAERDARAFAELVDRFGPMVFAVCRRVTGHHQDAEDAFQATFAVLARRADAVKPREAVGAWLHGVAVRTALEARTMAAKRRARVTTVGSLPEVACVDPEPDDVGTALHEELAAMPEKLRTLLVLCDLEGVRQVEVARRLLVPVGTVYSRLATARRMLADRLRRRGIALGASGLLGAVAGVGRAAVPPDVSAKAVATALAPQSLSATITALTEGVLRTMFLKKLKAVVPLIAIVAAGLLAVMSSTGQGATETPKKAAGAASEKPAVVGADEGRIVVWRKGLVVLLKPDGTTAREWKGDDIPEAGGVRLSPDGKTIAVLRPYETRTKDKAVDAGMGATLQGRFSRHLYRVTLYPVADKLVGTDLAIAGDSAESVVWSANGLKLYVGTHADDENYSRDHDLAHFAYTLATGKHAPLKLPNGHHLRDVSPDDKTFLTVGPPPDAASVRPVFLVQADGKARAVTEGKEVLYDGAFSPDGKRLLLCGIRNHPAPAVAGKGDGPVFPPIILDWDYGWLEAAEFDDPTRKRSKLELKKAQYANGCRWSPDGRRVVTFRVVVPPLNEPNEPREVVVSDADGRNAKKIFTDPDRLTPVFVDWR